jgi:hypothetical protein
MRTGRQIKCPACDGVGIVLLTDDGPVRLTHENTHLLGICRRKACARCGGAGCLRIVSHGGISIIVRMTSR